MQRDNRKLLIVLAVMYAAISLTGLTFARQTVQEKNAESPIIKLITTESEENEVSALKPGEIAETSISIKNLGSSPCYVRVKLCIPAMEGEEILQPGYLEKGEFIYLGSKSEKKGEYWTRSGEYMYYCNNKTGNQLLPEKSTAALYNAIRFNPKLSGKLLPKGTNYEFHVLLETAQAAGNGEQPIWKTQEIVS